MALRSPLRFSTLLFVPLLAAPLSAQPTQPSSGAAQAQPSDRAFLGAYSEPIDTAKENSGLRVTHLYPYSTAQDIGLKVGDEIIALNNVLIRNRENFVAELRNNNVDGTIRFLVRRDGKKVKLKGKIKGYRKTMDLVQKDIRKQQYGKPLGEQPESLVWNPKTKKLEPTKEPLAHLKGKIGLIVWYDDCSYCQSKRYEFLRTLSLRMANAPAPVPVAFAGLYFSDRQHAESPKANLDGAVALYTKKAPGFAAGVVHFPKEAPKPPERHKALYIYNHGVVLLDPEGNVAYLQIHGAPNEREIQLAMTQVLVQHTKKQQAGGAEKPAPGKSPAPTEKPVPPKPRAGTAGQGGR